MGIGYLRNVQAGSIARQTTEAITYYVSATGSDTNDGLTSGTAFATIQHALDILPQYILDSVVVNIGVGNFSEFSMHNFQIGPSGSLEVCGTLGAPTLTTGTTSGTSTGGTSIALIDAGQAWTANELIGHYLLVGGEYRIIIGNNGTTINVAKAFSGTTSSKVYSIVEPKTIINAGTAYGQWVSVLNVHGCTGWTYAWTIKNLHVLNSTGGGVTASGVDHGHFEQILITGAAFHGFSVSQFFNMAMDGIGVIDSSMYGAFLSFGSTIYSCDFYAFNNGWAGVEISHVDNIASIDGYFANSIDHGLIIEFSRYIAAGYLYAIGNYWHGIVLNETQAFDWMLGESSENYGHGLLLDYLDTESSGDANLKHAGSVATIHTVLMNNNQEDAVQADNGSFVDLRTVTGTGNAVYGIVGRGGSRIYFASTTTVTGTTGAATINGSTTLVYASDFAANGDAEVDSIAGTRMIRRD